MSEEIEKKEEVVIKEQPKKKSTKVKAKVEEKQSAPVISIDQFCRGYGVTGLDVWVAKRFFKGELKKESDWKKALDEKKIPYKR